MPDISRRRFLAGSTGVLLANALPSAVAGAMQLTPRQPEGPFYPVELPLDDDNDLVQVRGQAEPARGEISDLTGRILDRNGAPLRGIRIEIWQCDVNGRYRHPREDGNRPQDPGFQGFGHTVSDAEGRYRFRTIRPVSYPGRTPHIHVAVYPQGQRPLITQLYVEGEPLNERDFLYERIPADLRPYVTTPFVRTPGGSASLAAQWDVVLGVNASVS